MGAAARSCILPSEHNHGHGILVPCMVLSPWGADLSGYIAWMWVGGWHATLSGISYPIQKQINYSVASCVSLPNTQPWQDYSNGCHKDAHLLSSHVLGKYVHACICTHGICHRTLVILKCLYIQYISSWFYVAHSNSSGSQYLSCSCSIPLPPKRVPQNLDWVAIAGLLTYRNLQ